MRQILIKANECLSYDGKRLTVLAHDTIGLDKDLQIVRIPDCIEVLSGAANFKFQMAKHLTMSGFIVLGAYLDETTLEVAVGRVGRQDACVPKGEAIFEGVSVDVDVTTLVDPVAIQGGLVRFNQSGEKKS
jgi:hypothetical protein